MTKAKTRRAANRRNTVTGLNLNLISVSPMTDNQAKVLNANGRNQVLHGCAGTGKTFLSSFLAYQALMKKEYGKIVYIRSAVPTRDIGFLPGTEAEKVAVYELPYKEIANELFDRGGSYDELKAKGVVSFLTTSHVRGTTLNDSVVIVDEIQNMSMHELDSVITRYGRDCLYYFCGDFRQSDLKKNELKPFLDILRSMGDDFEFTEFCEDDIVRSDLVKRYIIARNKHESGNQ